MGHDLSVAEPLSWMAANVASGGKPDVHLFAVDATRKVANLLEYTPRSFLRQPRLAQAFKEMFSLRQEDGIVAFGPQLEAVNGEFRI